MVPALLDPPSAVRPPSRPDSDPADSPASALLERPEFRALLLPISVPLYETLTDLGVLPKRAELIRGFIVKKVPKSPLHRKLTKQISLQFLAQQGNGLVAFTEAPLRLGDSVPEPDAMIVRGEESDFDTRHPATAELVVEVAVSSVASDRLNATLYAEAGVPEYWIVLAEEKAVEVYRQPQDGVYRQKRLYAVNETLACESVPGGLQTSLADWFS